MTKQILLTLLVAGAVQAQTNVNTTPAVSLPTSSAATPADPAAPSVERVEVIGSRIKRIAKEGAAPVKNVGKESMEKSANTTASDTLRDSTLATYGASREASGSNAAAVTTIGLRGLGDTRTLVLLNGRRLPKDPTVEAVDLNLIPQSAIERIEVLKDGASALYGSDALGGVINIVTKKGYVGNEASLKFSAPERKGGAAYDVSLLSGLATENSDFMAALSYNHQDKVMGRDRDVTKDLYSPTGSPATWYDSNGFATANPGCPPDLLLTDADGTYCLAKPNQFASVRPQIGQLNLLTDYTYRFGSGLKLYNRNIVVHKDIEWNYAPTPAGFATPGGTASQPSAEQISYRYNIAGNRDNKDSELNYSTLVGLKGNLTSIWEYDVSAGYSEVFRKNRSINGYLDKFILQSLVANNLHDPLAPLGAQGDISSAYAKPFQDSKTNLLTIDAVVNGEIGEMENGPIGVAAGASVSNEKLDQKTDERTIAKAIIGSSGSNDSGSRDVQSAFAEVSFPLTSALELDAAGRVDHYSDFGTTFNPKLSAKWTINQQVLLRSSVGTGFKAPTLSQVYGASSDGFITFIDRQYCITNPNGCGARQIHVFGGGNKDLKEEKAFAVSLGTVIQPASNISFSLDTWYTKVTNIVGLDYEEMTVAESKGINLNQYGINIQRLPNGRIDFVEAKNLNLQEEEIAGVDFNFEILIANNVLGHQLTLDNDFSYIVFDKMEKFPGVGSRNLVGEWGMPKWRNTATVGLKNDTTQYGLTIRSIPGQNVQDRLVDEKISDLTEFDFSAGYTISKLNSVSAGVKNILDAEQPADPSDGLGDSTEVNDSLYDINGRKFFVGYTQKF